MTTRKPNLAKIILLDLFSAGRLPLLMLVLIFATAMAVVFVTHHTRQMISAKDTALVERERLDEEWRNLLLEENALSEHNRVQKVAIAELNMTRPDPDKEVVISQK